MMTKWQDLRLVGVRTQRPLSTWRESSHKPRIGRVRKERRKKLALLPGALPSAVASALR